MVGATRPLVLISLFHWCASPRGPNGTVVHERLTQASIRLDAVEVTDEDMRARRKAQFRRIDEYEALLKMLD